MGRRKPLDVKDVAQEVDLARLRPSPHDHRSITPEKAADLWRSLEKNPGMLRARPLVALPDGTLVAGHRRWHVLREHGVKKTWVFVADLDAREADEWMVRDNRPFGEDDEGALAQLLSSLQEQGADLGSVGYDADELDDLIAAGEVVPELPVEPFAGGFAESPEELAARAAEMRGRPREGTPEVQREVRLLFRPDAHTKFLAAVRLLETEYSKDGIRATVEEAVHREAKRVRSEKRAKGKARK